jgi:hypothetical protein
MLGLGHLLASALELLTFDHLCEIEIEQPRLLTFELREELTQRLSTCLESLGQPSPHLGALQFLRNQSRLS